MSAPDRSVMRWLSAFSVIVAFLILFGGFVRLTRAGLSIVEWKPVSGVVPPMGEKQWLDAFAAYRKSPEFLLVNTSMTLDEFRRIYLIEWAHRLVARLAGFAFAIPLVVFIVRKRIPTRDLGPYLAMGSLFVLQAAAGWVMVASGLVDRPSVSHINLTVHLLLAFTLLALVLWTMLDHRFGPCRLVGPARTSPSSRLAVALLAVLVAQITYGGLTAGLKAGHVSNTWPLMSGKVVPPALFRSVSDVVDAASTVMFIHRWFAFVVLAVAVALVVTTLRRPASILVRRGLAALAAAICLQIALGIATVLTSVEPAIALAHQGGAIALFAVTVFLLHQLRYDDAAPTAADAASDERGAGDAGLESRRLPIARTHR